MNICLFSGRLTKDAEIKTSASGTEVAKFTLAVDCGFGDRKRTEFISCTRFKPGGMAPYMLKGRSFIITCEYEESKWEKDGEKHSRPSWIVRDMEFGQGEGRASDGATQAQNKADTHFHGKRKEYSAADMGDAPFNRFEWF